MSSHSSNPPSGRSAAVGGAGAPSSSGVAQQLQRDTERLLAALPPAYAATTKQHSTHGVDAHTTTVAGTSSALPSHLQLHSYGAGAAPSSSSSSAAVPAPPSRPAPPRPAASGLGVGAGATAAAGVAHSSTTSALSTSSAAALAALRAAHTPGSSSAGGQQQHRAFSFGGAAATTPSAATSSSAGSGGVAGVLDHTLASYRGSPAAAANGTSSSARGSGHAAAPPSSSPSAAYGAPYSSRASASTTAAASASVLSPAGAKARAHASRAGGPPSESGSSSNSSHYSSVQAPVIVPRSAEDAELLPLCYGSTVVLRVCTGKFVAAEDVPNTPANAALAGLSSALVQTAHVSGSSSALAPHAPSVRRVHGASPSSWCAFTLLHSDAPQSRGEVQFMHQVALMASDGTFLSAEEPGAADANSDAHQQHGGSGRAYLTAEEAPLGCFRRNMADPRCKWTLLSAHPELLTPTSAAHHSAFPPLSFNRARGGVKIFDRVLLRTSGPEQRLLGLVSEADLAGRLNHATPVAQAAEAGVQAHCVLHMARANLPLVPEWSRHRGGALSFAPSSSAATAGGATGTPSGSSGADDEDDLARLNSAPPEVQEQLLLEDVLYALLAIEGRFIKLQDSSSDATSAQHGHSNGSSNTTTTSKPTFVPVSGLRDRSLCDQVSRLLPAANAYARVSLWVQVHARFEYGLVAHALAAALRAVLKEYLVLVAQLEHQFASKKLTLLRAWYYLQPALHSLTRLETLCARARGATGGALLNVLHASLTGAGDAASGSLYAHLLSAASVPYFAMLSSWLTQGVLVDPYDEFQVRANASLRKETLRRDFGDTYWEEKYTSRSEEFVPVFLLREEQGVKHKILTTGKYLNVIRECGRAIPAQVVAAAARGDSAAEVAAAAAAAAAAFSSADPSGSGGGARSTPPAPAVLLRYSSSDERVYLEPIDRLYALASQMLLDLLMGPDMNLMGRLRSIKGFFLFAQGDFYSHWMDLIGGELAKKQAECSAPKLGSLLSLAVKQTTAQRDPYHEDVRVQLLTATLVEQLEAIQQASLAAAGASSSASSALKPAPSAAAINRLHGFDSLALSYRVGWPLSLVLSKGNLTKYQLLFRHLLSVRHTERLLHVCWANHQSAKGLELGRAYHASFALRQRMLHLFHNLSVYMLVEVLEPAWHRLEGDLQSRDRCRTVDELKQLHDAFLDAVFKQCLLVKHALLRPLQKLIVTARHFAEHAEKTMQAGASEAAAGVGGSGGADDDSDREDSSSSARRSARHRRTGTNVDSSSSIDLGGRAALSLQQRADRVSFRSRVTLASVSDPNHQATVALWARYFDDNLRVLLQLLRQSSDAQYVNLAKRLDYNGWYENYFAKQPPPQQPQQQQQRTHAAAPSR